MFLKIFGLSSLWKTSSREGLVDWSSREGVCTLNLMFQLYSFYPFNVQLLFRTKTDRSLKWTTKPRESVWVNFSSKIKSTLSGSSFLNVDTFWFPYFSTTSNRIHLCWHLKTSPRRYFFPSFWHLMDPTTNRFEKKKINRLVNDKVIFCWNLDASVLFVFFKTGCFSLFSFVIFLYLPQWRMKLLVHCSLFLKTQSYSLGL